MLYVVIMCDDELFVFDNGYYVILEYCEGLIIYDVFIEICYDYICVVFYKFDLLEMMVMYQWEWIYFEWFVCMVGYLMFVFNSDGGENFFISWGLGGVFMEYNFDN